MLGHRQTKHMMTPTLTTTLIIIVLCVKFPKDSTLLDFLDDRWMDWISVPHFGLSLLKDSLPILNFDGYSMCMELNLIIEMLESECQKLMSRSCLRRVKIISVSSTDEHLRLPPTPPSSHGSDSDGSQSPHSLPPLSPGQLQSPHSLPPSSPARLQARTSTAISSSPLLTAPHVSHTQGSIIIYNPNGHFYTHTF